MSRFVARPSPGAQRLARGIAPVLGLVERTGQWPRLFHALQRRVSPTTAGFGAYQPDKHDVVVATYEKSGTNWMMQIVHQISTGGHGTFGHVHDVVPWPDGPRQAGAVALSEPTWRGTAAGLRPIKTHLPRSAVPFTDAARYVVVIRDPKDVVVSSYHFIRDIALGPLMPSPATWVDLFLSEQGFGGPREGPWPAHVDGWWRERLRSNVLVLRYEELIADLPDAIRRVADLMNVNLDQDARERVHANSTFAAMRATEERFHLGPFTPLGSDQGRMIRRGTTGGSAELLTAAHRRRIDDHCERILTRLGSAFPYADFYRRVDG